jgi:uncharacterized protein YbjT (DUF2867 family)
MFAVTGITGKVGAAVARCLLAAHKPVRAVVRDRSRSIPWAQLGCDIAVADLSDTEALTAAFAGAAGVFAMIPPVFDPAPGFPEAMGLAVSIGKRNTSANLSLGGVQHETWTSRSDHRRAARGAVASL